MSSLSWVSLDGLLLPTLLKGSEDKLFGSDPRKLSRAHGEPSSGQGRVGELLQRVTAHPPRARSNQSLPSGSLMSIFPLPRAELSTTGKGSEILLSSKKVNKN